ncbi:uncharacterized protein JCM15063_003691 [Sporobolomyces koalae]|uniref:uncharacterized protein n=1 Tax=Sporobolomyces koalae TaxID=500713 RepID=UPI00317110F3
MAAPAFRGFVESTLDALLVFEGCKRGYLPKISRRLQDYEKKALVVSGAIFVFDEAETGIKRWTDGLSWSPSRTLGNFLIYRELDKKVASNRDDDDDTGVEKNSRLMGGLTSKSDMLDDGQDLAPVPSSSTSRTAHLGHHQPSLSEVAGVLQLDRARERALVGSLTSSSRFRGDGLVKKTISLSGLHLVAYYRLDDVTSGRLRTPSSHAELMSLEVSPDFLVPTLFRMPPVVEIGTDGQVRYKGESETPISPLTRSGSSPGFATPKLVQSRPSTSDPNATGTPSQITPLLGARPPSRDYPSAPGSPRRGATATVRTASRFDPYGVGRCSPNATSHATATAYPFGHTLSPSQPSPVRSTFEPIGETTIEHHQQRDTPAAYEGIPSSRTSESLSSSAPASNSDTWYQQPRLQNQRANAQYQDLPAGRVDGPNVSNGNATTYYQPRRAAPYGPTSDASALTSMFSYNPPSTHLIQRRASEGVPSPLGYSQLSQQHLGIPSRPPSQPYANTGAQTSASSSQGCLAPPRTAPSYSRYSSPSGPSGSPYDSTPTNADQARIGYPFPSQAPQQPHPSPVGARNPPNHQTIPWHQNAPLTATAEPALPPTSLQGRSYDFTYTTSPPTFPGQYAYEEAVHQPSGLVVGYTEKQSHAVHGLGVSAVAEGPALGLYENEDLYRTADHAQTNAFRQTNYPTSSSTQHTYPSAADPAPPLEQMQQYPDTVALSESASWTQANKSSGQTSSLGGQASGGWWSPSSQARDEPLWPDQNHIKRERLRD